MVHTGVPQVDCPEMVESIAIATAARLAQTSRRRVGLKEVVRLSASVKEVTSPSALGPLRPECLRN